MKLRGYLAVGFVGFCLIVADVIQRTVIAGSVRLLPGSRHRILGWWQHRMADVVLWPMRVLGGASVGTIPTLPADPGTLVLMNHQSLLDIPLVVTAMRDGYPRIVTRERYARGKPLISHMVRLYQYPTVDPRATRRRQIRSLGQEAAGSPVPVVIYPEGTRTRDGSLGRWKRAGLEAILAARKWSVWIMVADGFWQSARLNDFLEGVSEIDGRVTVEGPFEGPEPGEDPGPFVERMREVMEEALRELRDGRPARDPVA